MRKLRTCEFCGGDAVGTFEVVPADLVPSGSNGRRAVLCEDCRTRLEGLLEPLLARARSTADADAPPVADREDRSSVDADDTTADSPSDSPESDRGPGDGSTDDGVVLESGGVDGSATDPADDGDESGRRSGGNGPGAASDRPRAYGKVIRLVRNREFPMDRSAVESLAAGAYDLDEFEAKKAIDRAIEEGELREDGEQLRRP